MTSASFYDKFALHKLVVFHYVAVSAVAYIYIMLSSAVIISRACISSWAAFLPIACAGGSSCAGDLHYLKIASST